MVKKGIGKGIVPAIMESINKDTVALLCRKTIIATNTKLHGKQKDENKRGVIDEVLLRDIVVLMVAEELIKHVKKEGHPMLKAHLQ